MSNHHWLIDKLKSTEWQYAAVVFAILSTLIAVLLPSLQLVPTFIRTPTSTLSLATCRSRSLYGFESDTMGWKPQEQIRTVLQVKQSNERAKSGDGSLELQVELRGEVENSANAEVFVDLSSDPPLGSKAPLDLEGVPIVIWVYAPKKAAGNPDIPNGVQVFVKDQDFRSEYGEWRDLNTDNTDRWIPVTLTPSKDPPLSGVMEPGFDSSQIIRVGIKIGVGSGSTVTYTGSIWIDDVCWPIP